MNDLPPGWQQYGPLWGGPSLNERHYWDAHWEHPNIGILFVVFRRNGLHYIRRAGSGWTEKDCRGPFESLNEAINLAEALAILEGKTP